MRNRRGSDSWSLPWVSHVTNRPGLRANPSAALASSLRKPRVHVVEIDEQGATSNALFSHLILSPHYLLITERSRRDRVSGRANRPLAMKRGSRGRDTNSSLSMRRAGPGRGTPGRRLRTGASAGAGCAVFTPTAYTAAGWPRCRVTSWRPGWPASGPASGSTSSPWLGCPSCSLSSCSTRCSTVTKRPGRWTPPRCGSCSPASAMLPRGATPTHTLSASPAAWEYNATTGGLFRDLRRHLEWAWAQYAGADPFAGDVWQVALLDLRINASRRWPATHGVIDFRSVEPRWLREIVKDWARSNRPYVQRLRETLRACQTASHTLTAAGRTDPAGLGAGDFTRILDAISGQRRADGSLYSASHRNLMLYQFCQVIEHGRAAGLMAAVPDPFRPTRRHRVREDPNEDELGKALPETVIGQLDAHLHLLGPAGRAGPITTDTAKVITTWQQRRTRLSAPPALDSWLFPSPLLRAQQSRGHVTPDCVGRTFKAWVAQIGTIDSELLGPDGTPAPFDPALITPYALRHTYAQRHADAGVPVDVLKELMGHVAVATTMGHYRVGLKRKQQAIYLVGSLAASSRPAEKTDCTINSGPGPGDRLLDEHPAGGEGTRLLKRRGRRPDLVATSHALHPGAGGADGRLEARRPAHAPDQPAASRATQLEGRRSPAARSVWSAASLSCTR